MKKIRYFIALWAAKAAQLLMKLLGRNATYLPGKIAIRISKDFLHHITPPKTVVAVTGTNGKTTVSNFLTSILTENGYSVTNNSFGSNVQAGVISALVADTTVFGKPKKDIAILEVDERSSLLIYPGLKPNYLVCNNLMRDSLKRNAHTEFISYVVNKALPATTKLILNGDDLIAAFLGTLGQEKVFFGLEAEKPEKLVPQHIQDIVYCPECGTLLQPEYLRYNHIGKLRCPGCGLQNPDKDYYVTKIDRENDTFTISCKGEEVTYNLINDNIVNIYNFCGAIAVLRELGLTPEQIAKGFSRSKIVKTRFEDFTAGDMHVTMLMAKGQNPIACARCFDYVAKAPGENKAALIFIDDRDDNNGNSESTCWLYDCDYKALADPSINQVIFGGPRYLDHLLRAKLAGVDPAKIQVCEDSASVVKLFDPTRSKEVFVLHELYRPGEAVIVKETLMAMGKGEV